MRSAILAGGGATRFGGRPKGLATIGGQRIIDRLADALHSSFGEPPILVANTPAAAAWRPGLEVVPDVRPGLGALGGIYTALVSGPGPVVVVAWDMPFVPGDLMVLLGVGLVTLGVDACVPASGGPRELEPLCAAYDQGSRAAIERAIVEGDLSAVGFHRYANVHIVRRDEIERIADPAFAFFNVNTPGDLEQAEALWQARALSQLSEGRTPGRRH